jgi:hypothetical protein
MCKFAASFGGGRTGERAAYGVGAIFVQVQVKV